MAKKDDSDHNVYLYPTHNDDETHVCTSSDMCVLCCVHHIKNVECLAIIWVPSNLVAVITDGCYQYYNECIFILG